jgi:hypothetical protein
VKLYEQGLLWNEGYSRDPWNHPAPVPLSQADHHSTG